MEAMVNDVITYYLEVMKLKQRITDDKELRPYTEILELVESIIQHLEPLDIIGKQKKQTSMIFFHLEINQNRYFNIQSILKDQLQTTAKGYGCLSRDSIQIDWAIRTLIEYLLELMKLLYQHSKECMDRQLEK